MRCRSALRLGGFACLLYLLSTNVDNYFEGQALPSQLTARNITITVRTIVRGLSYLLTFLFAANTIGLTGEDNRGGPLSILQIIGCSAQVHGRTHSVQTAPCTAAAVRFVCTACA